MDSDDKGCLLTVIFFFLSIASFGIILKITQNIIISLIPAIILFLIASICAGGRDDPPSSTMNF